MLNDLINELVKELDIQEPVQQGEHYTIPLPDDIQVNIFPHPPSGVIFKSVLGPVPTSRGSMFLDKVMEANLFGRGTRGSILGLNNEATHLTLSLEIPEGISYREFKEKLEDFISIYDFWRSESLKWK